MDINFAFECLDPSTDSNKQQLGQLLWNWQLCGQCTAKPTCSRPKCPWNRKKTLDAFWNLYEGMTDAYVDIAGCEALNGHSVVLDIIKSIKQDRTASQKDLLRKILESRGAQAGQLPSLTDQKHTFSISAGVLLLMDLSIIQDAANVSSSVLPPVPWHDEVSVDSFVKEAFHYATPRADLNRRLVDITAKRMMRNAKISFDTTDDVRQHLVLDRKQKKVWIFHQTTAVRELLLSSESNPTSCILPRAMLLEVLDTIRILFLSDSSSLKVLKSLVSKHGWNEGLLSDAFSFRVQGDGAFTYAYFGDRLEELHAELRSPTPHGWFEERLHRKSDMNMLKATVFGVLIAVVLTSLTLVVAVFQAWVAWQQWKHPVKDV